MAFQLRKEDTHDKKHKQSITKNTYFVYFHIFLTLIKTKQTK